MDGLSEFTVVYYSDKGAVKAVNQDSIAIKRITKPKGDLLWCGLFDGMGGLHYGEQVSAAAARWSGEWVKTRSDFLGGVAPEQLCREVETLQDRISTQLAAFGKKHGTQVGTTVVSLLFRAGSFLCWNVGDSRAYRLHGGELTQLSEDHNLAFELAEAGVLTREKARNDPRKNVLTRALGLNERAIPAFYAGDYEPGDSFLLCCDGFYHCLEEAEIGEAVRCGVEESEELQNTLRQLAACALSRGEEDNISAILVRINHRGER